VTGALQVANSYEHDEYGYGQRGEIAEERTAQNEKRMRKLDLARTLVPPPAYFGARPEDAEIAVVLFGSTKGPALEAIRWLAEDGIPVAVMQIVTVWPFPAKEVSAFLGAAERTAVVEGNYTGQLQGLIREHCLMDVQTTLHRYDGRPFSPEGVYEFVKAVIGDA
jgi:2-oxoglutarate ferredoxin oxidoreductase subunit alpha